MYTLIVENKRENWWRRRELSLSRLAGVSEQIEREPAGEILSA